MAGHSKWSNTKHKKARLDGIRQRLWEKFLKEISVAAKLGGGEIDSNPRLRAAVAKAKSNSLPNKNIDSAIAKGLGGQQSDQVQELLYEGYGAGGIAFIITALTDNSTRTVADLRLIFNKNGGSLGESGSVAWGFDFIGLFHISKEHITEEQLWDYTLESDEIEIKDLEVEDEVYAIHTTREGFIPMLKLLDEHEIPLLTSEMTYLPQTTLTITEDDSKSLSKMIAQLEDNMDVQDYYHNIDLEGSSWSF